MAIELPKDPGPPPGAGASEQQRLQWSQDNQEYWFAVNNIQNGINQEALARSNMQKAEHDALMEVARNLK